MKGTALAGKLTKLMIATIKIDGIRCYVEDGIAKMASGQPVPNRHIQSTLGQPRYNGMDGELAIGNPASPDCYLATMSGAMSPDGEPDFNLWAFDMIMSGPYQSRLQEVHEQFCNDPIIKPIKFCICSSAARAKKIMNNAVAGGFEGIVLRDPDAIYVSGRTPAGDFLKLKPFIDDEAKIIEVCFASIYVIYNERRFYFSCPTKEIERLDLKDGDTIKFKHSGLNSTGFPRDAKVIGKRNQQDMTDY